MVVADISDDRKSGMKNVGGIEPPTEPDLDNCDLDSATGEIIKRQCGYQLEK